MYAGLLSMHAGYYLLVRSSRVIGDFGGYRRLIVDFALFGREGLARKGSC
jgi:hypothetical protein